MSTGRYAPSPSGRMHLGNLMCCLLAWLSAKSKGGQVLLRIEDLDTQRCPRSYADAIVDDLAWLGLAADGPTPPVYQSDRSEIYQRYFDELSRRGLVYPCFCSRSQLHAASAPHRSDGQVIYAGTCRGLTPAEIAERSKTRAPAWRVQVPDEVTAFEDGHMGHYEENLARDCGDFFLRRADGVFAYQLAVVVDDALMGVDEVVRGSDLLSSTPRQLWLYRELGLTPPKFYHLPLLLASDGRRLSKRDGDQSLENLREKYTPEEIIAAYQEYALEYAQQQGISIQLAMASLLKSGTQTIQVKGLTPELSYVAFAFGMNLKGQITRGLSSVQFKTTSDGYSDGPNYGGSDWFKQSFYITNAYAGLTGYGWTNSVWTLWQGQDVTSVRYRTLTTKLFSQVFPDANDKQSITAFLKDDDYSYPVEESLLTMVNSTTGYNMVSAANMGTSYTLLSLATSSGGDETLCVNSVTTKTSTSSATWFMARPVKDEHYGPTHNTIAGVMQGVSVSSARYALFPQTAIAEIAESKYPQLIEEYGSDIKDEFIPYINGNGFAIVFEQSNGIKPSTTYVFMVTAKNSVGDALTKYGSVTTDAAPDASTQAATRSAAPLRSLVGRPIDNPGKFIFPMESFTLPADARPEGDLWTIIHNKQILK